MKRFIKRWMFKTSSGRVAATGFRLWHTRGAIVGGGCLYWRWLLRSREVGTFSYRTTYDSKVAICRLVSKATGVKESEVRTYLDEIIGELGSTLCREIAEQTEKTAYRFSNDTPVILDQRIPYYLLARAVKPRVTIQSGTARGVGAALLGAAAVKNAQEGAPGAVITTDIDPEQGYGIPRHLREVVQFWHMDSVCALDKVSSVDLYIHDTATGGVARREFDALRSKLSPGGYMLSTWAGAETNEFAQSQERPHFTFKDTVDGHWYHGTCLAIVGPATGNAHRGLL